MNRITQRITALVRTRMALSLVLIFLTSGICVQAQSPQFKRTWHANTPTALCFYNPAVDTTPARKIQMIYEPRYHFPTAPRGTIKAINFRLPPTTARFQQPGYAYNVQMSMGWTKRASFRQLRQTDTTIRDTFITGLTPVYSAPVVRQNVKDYALGWMRFQLNGTSFVYEPNQEGQNLVVEIKFGGPYVTNYFCLWDSGGSNGYQMLTGYRDSLYSYATFRDPTVMSSSSRDFGFDLVPVGIESGQFSGSFSLYPNPSGGRFHIGVDAQQPIKDLSVTVRNVTGQSVFARQYQPGITAFDTEIALPDVAPGVYILEMVADGERLLRRLQVE